MIGALAGDIIGSIYEWHNIKTTEFTLFSAGCRFTDDSVLTVALADAILNDCDYAVKLKEYYRRYPLTGYGSSFASWAESAQSKAYNSWGNGAAMRISPAGWAYPTLEETLIKAKGFTEVTHDHPEGIKGGCATAAAVFLARTGQSKAEIKQYIESTFGYDLDRTLDQIRPGYAFDISCQGTVPEAIIAFLESEGFEDAIRKAVSLGGDSDTLACITGGISQAFYGGVPEPISTRVLTYLDVPMVEIVNQFMAKYCQITT
jgi:ADP-ribosylglycohydrolase